MRLDWRLMLLCAAVIALIMAAAHVYLTQTIRDVLLAQRLDALTAQVRTAAENLADRWEEAIASGTLIEIADRTARAPDVRASVIDGAGNLLWDSEVR